MEENNKQVDKEMPINDIDSKFNPRDERKSFGEKDNADTITAGESGGIDLIITKMKNIQDHLTRLEREFQSKLKYNQHKEKIIDNLHSELQEHKNDLIKKVLRPVLMDVILIIDDIKKLINVYRSKDSSRLDPSKLLDLMETFPPDLEEILYRQMVEPFRCDKGTFDPSRQKVARTSETDDESKDKTVAQSIRDGYEWEGKVLRPELVEVYIFKADAISDEKKADYNTFRGDCASDHARVHTRERVRTHKGVRERARKLARKRSRKRAAYLNGTFASDNQVSANTFTE